MDNLASFEFFFLLFFFFFLIYLLLLFICQASFEYTRFHQTKQKRTSTLIDCRDIFLQFIDFQRQELVEQNMA
jgi:hypothetical protein